MKYGLNDPAWIDLKAAPIFRARCSDCTHFHPCPDRCRHGWCDKDSEFCDGTEPITIGIECTSFLPVSKFDTGWEEDERANQSYDRLREYQSGVWN